MSPHPDHDCKNCGKTHLPYSAHKAFAEKQEKCRHETIELKCKDCRKDLGESKYSEVIPR